MVKLKPFAIFLVKRLGPIVSHTRIMLLEIGCWIMVRQLVGDTLKNRTELSDDELHITARILLQKL